MSFLSIIMLFSAKIGLIYVYIIDASLNHFQGDFQGLSLLLFAFFTREGNSLSPEALTCLHELLNEPLLHTVIAFIVLQHSSFSFSRIRREGMSTGLSVCLHRWARTILLLGHILHSYIKMKPIHGIYPNPYTVPHWTHSIFSSFSHHI